MLRKRIFIILYGVFMFLGVNAQMIIPLEKDGGVFKIQGEINGLKLKFIFDTGASSVCISESVAEMMLENGYLSYDDIIGVSKSQVADGRIIDNKEILIKKIKLGEIVLEDVEGIIIKGQSAPLLFGQSAIKRLGGYSIFGDKLLITSENKNDNSTLTKDELLLLLEDAIKYYDEGAFLAALEKYKILYNNDILTSYEKLSYANCFLFTDNYEEAIDIYSEIIVDIENEYPEERAHLYINMGICLKKIKRYNSALLYFEKAKVVASSWGINQSNAIFHIMSVYLDRKEFYKAKEVVRRYIEEYLGFMEIEPKDCWSKGYKDEFLGELYNYLAICYAGEDINSSDAPNYVIISAAWGYKESIQFCKKNRIEYKTKPSNYEY